MKGGERIMIEILEGGNHISQICRSCVCVCGGCHDGGSLEEIVKELSGYTTAYQENPG